MQHQINQDFRALIVPGCAAATGPSGSFISISDPINGRGRGGVYTFRSDTYAQQIERPRHPIVSGALGVERARERGSMWDGLSNARAPESLRAPAILPSMVAGRAMFTNAGRRHCTGTGSQPACTGDPFVSAKGCCQHGRGEGWG